jgi:hypothetical protein
MLAAHRLDRYTGNPLVGAAAFGDLPVAVFAGWVNRHQLDVIAKQLDQLRLRFWTLRVLNRPEQRLATGMTKEDVSGFPLTS